MEKPIIYRGYNIYKGVWPYCLSGKGSWYQFSHDDWEPGDDRQGEGDTIEDCKDQIDEQIEERGDYDYEDDRDYMESWERNEEGAF